MLAMPRWRGETGRLLFCSTIHCCCRHGKLSWFFLDPANQWIEGQMGESSLLHLLQPSDSVLNDRTLMQLLVAPAPYTIVSDPSSAGDETANMVQQLKTDRWRTCGKTKEKLLLYPTCIVMEQPKTDTTQLSKDACAGNGRGHNYLSHFYDR